ncbi:MAG: phenylacetic acid degradation protein PaaY [Gammaproteobacteria bacterium]
MPVYAIEDLIPVIDPTTYVHPSAVIIGDVIIGGGCYIGPNAVLRGDFGRIIVGSGVNIQDTCVMHGFPGKDCVVEDNGHIGHGAVLHGCRIKRNALVGMNAVIMDNAVIGEESFVGAAAFVKTGLTCEARSLVVGNPASVKRLLNDDEIDWKTRGTREYQELARRSLESLREVEPLTEPQADRPRFTASDFKPKSEE